jgi:hypothetical protein
MEQSKSKGEKFSLRDWNLMLIATLFGIMGNMIVELFFQAVGVNHLAPVPSWVSLILVLSFTIIGFQVILPPRIKAGMDREVKARVIGELSAVASRMPPSADKKALLDKIQRLSEEYFE